MTDVAHAKPPAPILTRMLQLFGLAAVVLGGLAISTGPGCEELGCIAWVLGVYLAVWGVCALLCGLRGRAGLVFLVLALVLPLLVGWTEPLWALGFLLVVMALTRVSKDRLAPYYRSTGGSK